MRAHRTITYSKIPRQSLQLILPVVATAWLAAPTPAAASPITFSLSNVTATFTSPTFPVTADLSGTFTFDPTTNDLSSFDITVTSSTPGLAPVFDTPLFAGPVPPQFASFGVEEVEGANFSFGQELALVFANDLDTAPDNLETVVFGFGSVASPPSDSVTGSAVPTGILEPSALALLGTALAGLFLLRPRAKRRDRQIPGLQPESA